MVVARAPAPAGCQFIGVVVGSEGNGWTGPYTSNENLAVGAMNALRNNAHEGGANYVELQDARAGSTYLPFSAFFTGLIVGFGQQTDVTLTGGAYKCPAAALKLVPADERKSFMTKGWENAR